MVRPTTNIGKCAVNNCNNGASKLGLCDKHYMRHHKNGSTNLLKRNEIYSDSDICLVKDCENKQRSKNLCNKHYTSFLRMKKEKELSVDEYLKIFM